MPSPVTPASPGVRPYPVAGAPLLCNAGATRFVLSNEGNRSQAVPLAFYTAQLQGASPERHLAYCTFADFEIDGSGVAQPAYDPLAKGLGLQYVTGCLFRNLFIHHTAATGFGCDFLQDTLIQAVRVLECGRIDNGMEMGGAGIDRPQPRGIRIVGCHAEANRFGISDWGADGPIVTGCTMTGNLEAGFQVSAKGTTGIPGKGGLLTDCVLDGNLRDGVSIGNTAGPYTVRGNRITGNGRYGYHHQDLVMAIRPPPRGGGESVRYSQNTLVDQRVSWPDDGHRGKVLRVGHRYAVVAANDATTLTLTPIRPGSANSWSADTPPPGTPYELPAAPTSRAGIMINAAADSVTIRGNLIRDIKSHTQTHGILITRRGDCVNCRVVENDLDGNRFAIQTDAPPGGGHWEGNHGDQ